MSANKWVVVALAFIVLGGTMILGDGDRPRPDRGCEDSTMAYIMSQEFVKRRLRSPSTAEFPYSSDIVTRGLGNCRHSIAAYFDAQNGFGAMIRSHYTATMRYAGSNKWTLESMQIDE